MRNILFLFFACFPLMMCSQQKESLKEKFEDYFLIGATINQEDYQLIDKDEKVLEIVSEEFNSVTPENSMKDRTIMVFNRQRSSFMKRIDSGKTVAFD